MLSSSGFVFLHLISRSVIHFELHFVKKCVSFVSRFLFAFDFARGCLLLQHLSLKDYFFSSLNCLCSFVKDHLAVFMQIYFWIDLFVYYLPIPGCLDYRMFIVGLEVSFSLLTLLLFQQRVGYSRSFASLYKLYNQTVPAELLPYILIEMAVTLQTYWGEQTSGQYRVFLGVNTNCLFTFCPMASLIRVLQLSA